MRSSRWSGAGTTSCGRWSCSSRKELYTLQVGLNTYAGQLNVQWHFILAMTVVTMIPVVLVFVFLQRFITSGIAGTGLK